MLVFGPDLSQDIFGHVQACPQSICCTLFANNDNNVSICFFDGCHLDNRWIVSLSHLHGCGSRSVTFRESAEVPVSVRARGLDPPRDRTAVNSSLTRRHSRAGHCATPGVASSNQYLYHDSASHGTAWRRAVCSERVVFTAFSGHSSVLRRCWLGGRKGIRPVKN